jgi:hypothetical protein
MSNEIKITPADLSSPSAASASMPTPIYRGDLADVKSQLAEVLAKLQVGQTGANAVQPAFGVLDFIRMMSDIERAALDVAWQTVPKNASSAQLADWLARGEIVARYMRRRLGLPVDPIPTPAVPPQ